MSNKSFSEGVAKVDSFKDTLKRAHHNKFYADKHKHSFKFFIFMQNIKVLWSYEVEADRVMLLSYAKA